MANLFTTEIKSDLLRLYKISGDLLNTLETEYTKTGSEDSKKLLETTRFVLMDIGGTLQKDIFNCDYLESMLKVNENWSRHNSAPSGQQ